MADVGFTDLAGADYHLASGSPYKGAGSDGKDIGADIDAVESATCGAINGTYCTSSGPSEPSSLPVLLPILLVVVAVVLILCALFLARRRRRRTGGA